MKNAFLEEKMKSMDFFVSDYFHWPETNRNRWQEIVYRPLAVEFGTKQDSSRRINLPITQEFLRCFQ